MPDATVVAASIAAAGQLQDWSLNPSHGGSLAGHSFVDVRAVAGAGKSRAVNAATVAALGAGARILIVAFTNDQVRDLARNVHAAGVDVFHLAADGEEIPNPPPGLTSTGDRTGLANASCVIATVYKTASTAKHHPGDLGRFDLGFVDEAYQVGSTSQALWTLERAPRWAFVGDPGQIEVFTPLGSSPFLGADDPVQSIVDSARAQGTAFGALHLGWTWRLPSHGAPILTPFYGHASPSAALPADRAMIAGPRRARRGLHRCADDVVDHAARSGWSMLELPGDALDPGDPATASAVATVVESLLDRQVQLHCERYGTRSLDPSMIGVAVASNAQVTVAAQALADLGISGVDVRTYNRHQGLEYAVTVAWHPLSGVVDVDPFALDLGRLCVGVSRHRHACILVGRAAVRDLLADPPLSGEAPWPGRRDRFLAGWRAHAGVIDHLDRLGVTVRA